MKKAVAEATAFLSKFFFQNYLAIDGFDGEFSVFVDHIALLKSSLWKRDGAWVKIVIIISKLRADGYVGMTVEKYLALS